jgi:hypothetical protein
MTRPTSDALARRRDLLIARMRTALMHNPEAAVDALLDLQHGASVASVTTTTHHGAQEVKVYDLDRYRRLNAECHDDDPEAA